MTGGMGMNSTKSTLQNTALLESASDFIYLIRNLLSNHYYDSGIK